ncbi:unnamed protein product [Blepharisma stoltei]|uniref:LITAF domain-containing protein n=1 Tax=Blepharisma stoltei TaxID=1481888 RepID=A0AAU9IY98_9CILI|nr:unnamed protein product [Blepharisma stoltei]
MQQPQSMASPSYPYANIPQSGPPPSPYGNQPGSQSPNMPQASMPPSANPYPSQGYPYQASPQNQQFQPYQPIQPGQAIMYAQPQTLWTNRPQIAFCPHCRLEILTSVKYEPGAVTYLSCLGLVCVGCFWGCCLVPFCITELQDCSHYCSSCNNFIYKKSLI